MSSRSADFVFFIVQTLVIDKLIKMVEPVSISLVVGTGALCTAGGFLVRYIYDKATEEPKKIEENKMGNVIVTNIKEAVEVEDHQHVVIGLYMIVAILILMIAIYFVQKSIKSIKKRTLRRAISTNNALTDVV